MIAAASVRRLQPDLCNSMGGLQKLKLATDLCQHDSSFLLSAHSMRWESVLQMHPGFDVSSWHMLPTVPDLQSKSGLQARAKAYWRL